MLIEVFRTDMILTSDARLASGFISIYSYIMISCEYRIARVDKRLFRCRLNQ